MEHASYLCIFFLNGKQPHSFVHGRQRQHIPNGRGLQHSCECKMTSFFIKVENISIFFWIKIDLIKKRIENPGLYECNDIKAAIFSKYDS